MVASHTPSFQSLKLCFNIKLKCPYYVLKFITSSAIESHITMVSATKLETQNNGLAKHPYKAARTCTPVVTCQTCGQMWCTFSLYGGLWYQKRLPPSLLFSDGKFNLLIMMQLTYNILYI